ncbi:MAG: hypothetical protein ACOYWZ_01145 [Bacillota bacterium]
MKRRTKIKVRSFLAFLLIATILSMSVIPLIVEAAVWEKSKATAQSQILNNDEMKEIVGGGRL